MANNHFREATGQELDYVMHYKFSHPDENDATTYHVRRNVIARTQDEAFAKLRIACAHLTLDESSIEIVAIFSYPDGESVIFGPRPGM